jgi:hypothetical protein
MYIRVINDIICYDVIIMSIATNESVKRLTELIFLRNAHFFLRK